MATVEVVIQEGRVPASVDQGATPVARGIDCPESNQPERVSAFVRIQCPLAAELHNRPGGRLSKATRFYRLG